MFITVSSGLKWCHRYWLFRSHSLGSRRAYLIWYRASLTRCLNVLLYVARTFVSLEPTEHPVSWQICTVADEVRWIRTKYPTFKVFNCAPSKEIILSIVFKIMILRQENNFFDSNITQFVMWLGKLLLCD